MKLSEIKAYIEANETTFEDMIKSGQIHISPKISLASKACFMNEILGNVIKETEFGIKYIDYIAKEVYFNIALISYYTDIDLFDIENFDEFLDSANAYTVVRKAISSDELYFLMELYDNSLAEIKEINNSLSAVVSKALFKLTEKLPDQKEMVKILNKIPSMVNRMKPEKVEMLKGIFNPNTNGTV